MRHPLLRPLLVIEFLLALQVCFTLWSHVGGEYHLTLVFWPWKLGIGLGAATLVVAMTAALVQDDGEIGRRVLSLAVMLVIVMLAAGALSYSAHLNEPADDNQDDEPGATMFSAHHARQGGAVSTWIVSSCVWCTCNGGPPFGATSTRKLPKAPPVSSPVTLK